MTDGSTTEGPAVEGSDVDESDVKLEPAPINEEKVVQLTAL